MVRRARQRALKSMQEIRRKLLSDLEMLFDVAVAITSGKKPTGDDVVLRKAMGMEIQEVTPKQRQVWARIAAYIKL